MAKDNKKPSMASKIGQNVQGNMSGAMGDQFSNSQGNDTSANEDTSSQLMKDAKEKVNQVKEAPGKVKDTYNKGKETVKKAKELPKKAKKAYNKAKNLPNKMKELSAKMKKAAEKTAKVAQKAGKAVINAAKTAAKFVVHPVQTLKEVIAGLPQKVANGLKSLGNFLNPKKWLQKLNPKKWLDKINPIKRIRKRIERAIKRVKNTIKAVKNTIKVIQKVIKMAIKAIKLAIKVAVKLVQLAIQIIQLLIQLIIATWPIWLVLLILGIIVGTIWWILDNDSTSDNKSLTSEKSEYNETKTDKEGNAELITISGNTKIVEAFYQYFAEKSIWVVYDGLVYNDTKIEHDDVLGDVFTPLQRNTESFNNKFMDENGEIILKDYQNRESMFYINPNALFVYDKYLHGEQIRFPEQIVQHVAYDYNPESLKGQDINETNDEKCLTEYDSSGAYNPNYNKFILKHLTDDEERFLTITSQKYKLVKSDSSEVSDDFRNHQGNIGVKEIYVPDGEEETLGVWDYGLGSILHYVKYLIKHENRGIYENFQVWDKTMQMDDDGLLYYGEPKEFANYEEYEDDTNHENYDATDIADLEGDDRLVTYTAENAPTELMRQQLADEDSYFIDWVVTAAGDVSNHVVYEWKDSGQTFSQPEPFQKEVTRFDEVLQTTTTTKTVHVGCGKSKTVTTDKLYNRPFRNSVDDTPTMYTEEETFSCPSCDDPNCDGQDFSYTYTEEKIIEQEVQMNVTFNADVNGTTWNKQPFYDGFPSMENISGRRYYEDYLTHYHTYVPSSVSGFFNKEQMLRRIQLDITDPDLEEELTKILERSEMKNGGNNSLSSGSGYTMGSGSSEFEQLYNGSARETIDRIWDGIVSWGYSEEQAAAILGNMFTESRFRTDAINSSSGASGIVQWTNGRLDGLKNFAAQVNNADWTDLNSQIQYICMEIDTNKYNWADYQWSGHETEHQTFMTSSDPSELAYAFMTGIERCGDNGSQFERMEVATIAYSILSGKEIEYPIDKVNPSTEGSFGSDASGGGGTNIFTSIWNWLKGVGDFIKEGIKTLFGFEDEYFDIMEEKERYEFMYHSVQESDVDYLLQSIFAYTDNVVISEYYGQLTDDFFIERFTDLFSNPIGTHWQAANSTSANKTEMSNYMTIRQENYPDGFQRPLEECRLGHSTSNYGIYLQATDGENVFAVCDGTITKVGEDDRYGGKYLILDNGYSETIYGHLKDIHVSKGQDVSKGDIIATVEGDEMFFGITNEYKAKIDPSFVLSNIISDGTLAGDICSYASQFVGERYVFGGSWNGELPYTATDCSGFVQGVFKHYGINLSRTTSTQVKEGIPINESELLPGDIILYAKNGSVHHVALYVGNGNIVHAKGAKYGVVFESMNYSKHQKICRRILLGNN